LFGLLPPWIIKPSKKLLDTEEKKMKNDTMKNNTATELDFNDLEMVSGGLSLNSIFDTVEKSARVIKDVYDWIVH
jgi:hypothetical protein